MHFLLILRPTMFPLELQVALLKSFLDFIHGYQCFVGSSINLNLFHNTAILSWYTCQDVSDLVLLIKYMIQLLKLVYLHGQLCQPNGYIGSYIIQLILLKHCQQDDLVITFCVHLLCIHLGVHQFLQGRPGHMVTPHMTIANLCKHCHWPA